MFLQKAMYGGLMGFVFFLGNEPLIKKSFLGNGLLIKKSCVEDLMSVSPKSYVRWAHGMRVEW